MSPGNLLVTQNPQFDAHVSSYVPHQMMTMSGTSMATPVVAGSVALLLNRNPSLTPNLVKAVLEYTAQPLQHYSNYEQGAGLLNVKGAATLAGAIRQDLSSLAVGAPLLTGPAPDPHSIIEGQSITWGCGLIQKWNFISGANLMTTYQGIYGTGVLLSDGVLLSQGVLVSDGVLLTDGVLLSDGVLVSDGTVLSNGVLLTDGVLLSDGVLLADGVLVSDGVLLSDSYVALNTSPEDQSTVAMTALNGEVGDCMVPVPDLSPTD